MTNTRLAWASDGNRFPRIYDANGDGIAEVFSAANAARIVTACNAHDELVYALETTIERLDYYDRQLLAETGSEFECELDEVTRGRAAIAKAKEVTA